jgi:hypothetical protein
VKQTPHNSAAARRAIILFVRDERREWAAKPLPSRYRGEGYVALNRRIVQRLAPLCDDTTDLLVVREGGGPEGVLPQRGGTFGERISNAFADAFALGYRDAVIVGNDCPTLAPADIIEAFATLGSGASVVAAPSRDGGSYLIAARAGRLDLEEFQQLPWQTSDLFAALVSLPAASALLILREDFDCWTTTHGYRALDEFFGGWLPIPVPVVPSAPIPSSARRKALTRIFRPAPPLV